MTAVHVGDFVLDAVAIHGDETGAAEELGVRGLVYAITADWADRETGEIGDVAHVATSHHAQLRSVDLPVGDIAHRARASRIDAARYKTLAARRIGQDGRKTKPWVVTVLTVAEACLAEAPDQRDVPSLLPTTAELAAHDAQTGGQGRLRTAQDLADMLAADTDRRRAARNTS